MKKPLATSYLLHGLLSVLIKCWSTCSCVLLCLCLLTLSFEVCAVDAYWHGQERTLRYTPEGEDFVCVNGSNRFTRALYGSQTLFRLETSDRPVFATYSKNNNKHIAFKIKLSDRLVALDSSEYCKSVYKPGRRDYEVKDEAFEGGILRISVQAFYDKEGAIWKFDAEKMPEDARLVCLISEIKKTKLSRSGDLGADPHDAFEMPDNPKQLKVFELDMKQPTAYVVFENFELLHVEKVVGEQLYGSAEAARLKLANTVEIHTPDPYFNTLGGALSMAADGIWDNSWLHGAIGWRMKLNGWRAAYVGDVVGWHDRARIHFDGYAASQTVNVEPIISHPAQDTALHLARAAKIWGTPMYSNGYICRNPNQTGVMHHYDMNLCYIDELLWHFSWTGDMDYVRKMWSVLERHLAWEKRNFDPDNDGLYDAYCCIWASDALQYNSGGVTHSSAYNYRANKMAAEIAQKIGKDPKPYADEANKILAAINQNLWLNKDGHWAEYKDFMGLKRIHPNAAVWTIYHALDSKANDEFQAYQATRYVDTKIPHILVLAKGLKDEGYATISTTNWMPYSWSINNVAFAEVNHTALAYWQSGRYNEAFKLFKSSILDGMYLGASPGNFGQVSFYDAARGECYRDFGDPVGITSRTLVQGLFGVYPDAMNGRWVLRPGFPDAWDYASIQTPDLLFDFKRKGSVDEYVVKNVKHELVLQLKARYEKITTLTVNGKKAAWSLEDNAAGYPLIKLSCPPADEQVVRLEWGGKALEIPQYKDSVELGSQWQLHAKNTLLKIYDTQEILSGVELAKNTLSGVVEAKSGYRTLFVQLQQGQMTWWQPIDIYVSDKNEPKPYKFALPAQNARYEMVNMDTLFNASVSQIFKNVYLTPRSPYTTLQVPTQGIGEWCHPLMSADIDDSGLRAAAQNDVFTTPFGLPFRTPSRIEQSNISFTSLWDNYPTKVDIPLKGSASHAYLLMAGSTNHMQFDIANAVVRVRYSDGSTDSLVLVNPETWAPIEQDFYVDEQAFAPKSPRPYRVHLKSGVVSQDLGKDLNIEGVYGRPIEGGAGIILDLALNKNKELKSLSLEILSNEVVVGLMGVTLVR